jgi:adenylate cyclase
MPSTDHQDIEFGPFRLNRHNRSLTREGVPVPIGGRAFDILAALATVAGETVSKDALLDQVWPGLTVEENNLQVHISALRKALGEGWIITDPGRGYRLAVSAASTGPPLPDKPSIATLSFENLSGDPSQDYLGYGFGSDIITELARNRSLFLIARPSSVNGPSRVSEVNQFAHDFGVRYVIGGSVRRHGNKLRVNAHLIDTDTGRYAWTERYDCAAEDLIAGQDEITRAIVEAVEPAIAYAERQRAIQKPPGNLSAWEAWHRALWHWSKGGDLGTRRQFLQRAIDLDPYFAPAHAMLVRLHLSESTREGVLPLEDAVKRAEYEARTALALDPYCASGHAAQAWVFDHQGAQADALEEALNAITLNPHDPQGYLIKGHILARSGRPADAREPLTAALRLDPLGPTAPAALYNSAVACYFAKDYLAAEAVARRAIRGYPEIPRSYLLLAASLGQLGRAAEAHQVLDMAKAFRPYFEYKTARRAPSIRPDDHDHFLDGLRKAGWQG